MVIYSAPVSKPISKLKLGPRREVVRVEWNKMTREQKTAYLTEQQAEIRRTEALLKRFERLTERWLNNVKRKLPRELAPKYITRGGSETCPPVKMRAV